MPHDALGQWLTERGLGAALGGTSIRDRASNLVIAAMNFLDVHYRFGGNNEAEGFDCSGFTRYLFERIAGIRLPRTAEAQALAPGFEAIQRESLEPGDLVFFNTLRATFSHVGLYVGEGKFIHAPRAGAQVRLDNLHAGYWRDRFTGARRPES